VGLKLPFYDEYIEFSDTVLKYNDLRSNYILLINNTIFNIGEAYLKLQDEYIKDNNYQAHAEYLKMIIDKVIDEAISFSIYTLMQYGIETYTRDRFKAYVCDSAGSIYKGMGVSDVIMQLYDSVDEINQAGNIISETRQVERNSRSKYVNLLSTNLSGAISGEISAGIMNAGLGAVRGIKDAWTDSSDKAKLRSFAKEKLLDSDFVSSYILSVRNPFLNCFEYTVEILCEKGCFEDIITIDLLENREENLNRIYNNIEFGNKEKAKGMIKDYLKIYPYEVSLYVHLYKTFGDEKYSIIRMADYFDVIREYRILVGDKADSKYLENGNVDEKIILLLKEYEEYKKAHLK